MTERPTSTPDRSRDPRHDSHNLASRKATFPQSKPADATGDPLAALERARRHAFEAQEAERWDGLS